MKTYITGTTRGLGEALVDKFQREMIFGDVIGLNRPDYDLSKSETISKIVDDTEGFDVFVNNAHCDYAQLYLLYALFERNKDRDCIIINIGSTSADGDRMTINKYAVQKKALDSACTQLQLVPSKCKVMQVKLGHMDTAMIRHIDSPKMHPVEVARKIVEIYNMSLGNNYFKTVTLDNKL